MAPPEEKNAELDIPRVRELFESALAGPEQGRDAFLRKLRDEDPEACALVARMLDIEKQPCPLLDDFPFAVAPFCPSDKGGQLRRNRIGTYSVEREIAIGGMGSVYLAERPPDSGG